MKKKNKTLQEEWDEVGRAWREFVLELAKLLGIIRLLDWLSRKINR